MIQAGVTHSPSHEWMYATHPFTLNLHFLEQSFLIQHELDGDNITFVQAFGTEWIVQKVHGQKQLCKVTEKNFLWNVFYSVYLVMIKDNMDL